MTSAAPTRYPHFMISTRKVCLFVTFLVLAPLSVAMSKAHDPFERQRAAFLRAYADAETGQDDERRADPEALRTYPLYPYLQAARIRRALAANRDASAEVDEHAQTFTTYYEHEPVGRALRRVWLESLAARQQWPIFLEQYRTEVADDSLECESFTARIELGLTDHLAPEIARQWLTPRSLPACERAFDWLRAQNALTPALIEQRVRGALENANGSFARQIAASLPAERAAPLLLWAALLENPQRQIDALIASPAKAVEPDALLAGWTRLARRDRDGAMRRLDQLIRARKLPPEEAGKYALAVALPLAWDRRPEALTYFERVDASNLDDYALEWQARAALWADDWKLASTAIAAMSDEQRAHARWRYWAGRAAEKADDPALARQLYESVLIDDNFYSVMAAARLDQTLAPHPEELVADPVRLLEIEQLPEFVRARELVRADMRSLAYFEWRQGYERLPETARAQSVHLAARWGWYDQMVATATQVRVFNDYELLYPLPFDREVHAASRLSELPVDLIYSVMRQESLYRADAMSSAGARGLLQMLPETARSTARAWKRPRPSPTDLFDPQVNVPLGAAFLRGLVDRFDGQILVALAGYNAGPNAAARWLPAQSIEPDVWVENIPYNETRSYVQRILWHNVVFGWLRSGEPQKSAAWLTRITPLEGADDKRVADGG